MNNENDNVTPLRPHYSIFNRDLRTKMEEKVQPIAKDDRATEVVDTVESVICTYAVGKITEIFTRLGKRAGEKLVSKFDKAVNE